MVRSRIFTKELFTRCTFPLIDTEQRGVSSVAKGTVFRIRLIAEQNRRTGQRTGSLVRHCVRASILIPFFWSMNVTVTNSAKVDRKGESLLMGRLSLPQNWMQPSVRSLVRPGLGAFECSHDRAAKKKPPMVVSAACA